MASTPPIERALSRLYIEDDCWLWPGANNGVGYGTIGIPHPGGGRTQTYVHRLVYEHFIGPIPEGLVLDHICRIRNCANPDHLEAVTPRENIMRGLSPMAKLAARTHCNSGHLYDEANTYYLPEGGRKCRTCNRERVMAYYNTPAGRAACLATQARSRAKRRAERSAGADSTH